MGGGGGEIKNLGKKKKKNNVENLGKLKKIKKNL
jgi:hypothetical protein